MKRIAIGVGCRKDCYVAEIIELVHVVLEKSNLTISDIGVMATGWMKEDAEVIIHAAEALDLPLMIIPKEKCDAMSGLAETKSEKVIELFAIPSVAEVAALAAVGKNARLICPRISSALASCAVAISED
jgi:cobalt-precorrin 5A hydrolase